MPYVTPVTSASRINFLASAHLQSFTTLVPAALGVAAPNGRLIVPAGTILPTNDAEAKGILFADVDVTYGDQPGSLIVEGYIIKERLPVVPDAAAETAMTEIKFYNA